MIRYFIILFLLWAIPASASDIYIAQLAQGTATGVDAANAKSLAAYNVGGLSSAGDTVHLVGSFYNPLICPDSGSVGNPITLLFEPGANFTTNCWTPSGAIQLNHKLFITIDGVGTPTSTNGCIPNGIIQNTSNGTGLTTSNDSVGIAGEGFYITVKNLTITNIYVRTNAADLQDNGGAVQISGSDITVTNCNLSDGSSLLFYFGPQPGGLTACSNIYYVNNKILNYNHGIGIGEGNQDASGQNITLTNVNIAGNWFDHSDIFDDVGPTLAHHLDAIYLVSDTFDSSVRLIGFTIANNVFGPHMSNQGLGATSATDPIGNYFDYPQAQQVNVKIYNNVVMAPVGGTHTWGNAFNASGSNVWCVNNTLAGGVGLSILGTNNFGFNNLLLGGGGANMNADTTRPVFSSLAQSNYVYSISNFLGGVYLDYNIYDPVIEFDAGVRAIQTDGSGNAFVSGIWHPLSAWQNMGFNGDYTQTFANLHCDPHSALGIPTFVGGGLVPAATDTVTLGGTNLNTLFGGLFATDFAGTTRTPGRIGAFEPILPPAIKMRVRRN